MKSIWVDLCPSDGCYDHRLFRLIFVLPMDVMITGCLGYFIILKMNLFCSMWSEMSMKDALF